MKLICASEEYCPCRTQTRETCEIVCVVSELGKYDIKVFCMSQNCR